jgi:hypothetical protein
VKIQPETLALLVHIGLILVCAIFIFFGKLHLRKEHLIPLCLIPVFGPLVALVIEFMIRSGRQGTRSLDLADWVLEDDILWAGLRSFHEKGDLVPLEEAILIDEVKVRRRSMLETLYADPFKYLDVLSVAKYNDDIETSHYATTTISKAQKDFQLSVQKYAAEVERYPDDPEVLDVYIEILRKYIQSGLLEENLLRNLRLVYSKMLDRKLVMVEADKKALTEKLRNAVEVQDYAGALDTSHLLRKYWPEDEQTWIEALRVCVEAKDCVELQKTIEEIQRTKIVWTEQGREQVSPWMKMITQ